MKRYSFHPACLLFPQLGTDELQELAEDIQARGLLHDIILYKGQILDGRNRYLACGIAGVKPSFANWHGAGSPVEWVISENLIRRHLTSSQRAVIALDMLPLLENEAKERQRLSPGRGKRYPKNWIPFLRTERPARLPPASRRPIRPTCRRSRPWKDRPGPA